MNFWLGILGITVILIAGSVGLLSSWFKQWSESPEVKEAVERARKEQERQKAWKDNFKP